MKPAYIAAVVQFTSGESWQNESEYVVRAAIVTHVWDNGDGEYVNLRVFSDEGDFPVYGARFSQCPAGSRAALGCWTWPQPRLRPEPTPQPKTAGSYYDALPDDNKREMCSYGL
jgi:hypothetical protein